MLSIPHSDHRIRQVIGYRPSRSDIVPIDEPTLYLDINHRFDLMDVCRRVIARHNITIILVTHDLQIVARCCDHVLVMEHGRIVSMGRMDEVVNERMIKEVFHMVDV